MASRTTRSLILAFSKVLNYSVQFLTPILLVRILDRQTYGEYKEFFVYASLIGTFVDFGIKDSTLFFISKYIEQADQYVSSSSLMKIVITVIGILAVLIFQDQLLEITSVNYIVPLVIFLFFAQNLDFIEQYWLAKQRSDYVLYFSFVRAFIRVLVVLVTAYLTEDLFKIFYALIILEVVRFIFTLIYFIKEDLFTLNFDWAIIKEQVIYVFPLGLASILLYFNDDISKIIITTNLGAASLALYAVASQRIPIVNIIRSSISDVIFPDMAQKIATAPLDAISLWKKANLLYLFLMLPLFFIQYYYAEIIIKILFTEEYLGAVLVFKIYLFYFLKQCFEMGTPIRAKNKNKFFLTGYIFASIVNIGLLYLLFNVIGFIGPAIAFVTSEILLAGFFGYKIIKIYDIKLSDLFFWTKIFKIAVIFTLSALIFIPVNLIKLPELAELILGSTLYYIISFIIFRKIRIEEVDQLMQKLFTKLKMVW